MDYTISREVWLPHPREDIFAFFAEAGNLEQITPPELHFTILTPLPVHLGLGSLLDYRLRLFGLPFRWQSLISQWQPPDHFVDEQLRGPYRRWRHSHFFIEQENGTLMRDEVCYQLPGGLLGRMFQPLVHRQLKRIFDYRRQVISETFTPSADG